MKTKQSLENVIDQWVLDTQEGDDPLDMWISETLVDAMTNAAWSVLQESQNTQRWMKKEGHCESEALEDRS